MSLFKHAYPAKATNVGRNCNAAGIANLDQSAKVGP